MDKEILNTVHSLFGTGVKVVDCEKVSSVCQEETLLINGVPIKLDGMPDDDADAIKTALLDGQMPSVDLLNQLLFQAGLVRQPLELETSLSVKSSLTTTEEVSVSRRGHLLNERTTETKEDYVYQSNKKEIWTPILERDIPKLMRESKKPLIGPLKSATFAGGAIDRNGKNQIDDANLHKCSSSTSSVGTASAVSNATSASTIPTVGSTSSNYSNATTLASASSSAFSNIGDCSAKRSSLSCDSGHDGIFHSVSQSAPWLQWQQQPTTANSLSSCYDIASSSDEVDFVQLQSGKGSFNLKGFPTTQGESIDKAQFHASSALDVGAINPNWKYEYLMPQTTSTFTATDGESVALNKERLLVCCDGKLISGTLEALITHLVPTSDYYPDENFLFAMLLSAKLFVQPHELLTKIVNIWDRQSAKEVAVQRSANSYKTSSQNSAKNMVRLLTQWMTDFPLDFRDELLMREVRALTKRCVGINYSLSNQVTDALQKLVHILTELVDTDSKSSETNEQSKQGVPSNTSTTKNSSMQCIPLQRQRSNSSTNSSSSAAADNQRGMIDLCASPINLAHQLTAIELEYLSRIRPEELLQTFAKDFRDGDPTQPRSVHEIGATKTTLSHTLNLEAYVRWFNRLSFLTATEIVKCPKKRQRKQLVEYFIETARECFNIGNFNSLMGILAGLNLSAVSRLKKTWAKVQSAKFSVLEHQMDPTSNFNSYRSTMKAAVWRSEGARDERERVIIPFFTLFLKDLLYLNESFSTRLPNNHINFEKCSLFAKQMRDFIKWKQTICPYEKLPKIIDFVRSGAAVFDEKTLALASFTCEPPEKPQEKERYKKLKSEITK